MKRITVIIVFVLLTALLSGCFVTSPSQTTADNTEKPTASVTGAPSHTSAGETAESIAAETDTERTTDAPSAEKTAAVEVKDSVLLSPTSLMIYGKCEKDCVIRVKNGDSAFEIRSDGDNFCFAVTVKTDEETEISVTATAEGKSESDAVKYTVQGDASAEDKGLTVTYGSRVIEKKILPYLYGTNTFSDYDLKTMKELVEYRVNKAREASGKDTEIIIVIAPTPLSVYDEELTDGMRSHIENRSARMKQTKEVLSQIGGVTFLDLTDILIANKSEGKLYYKLDSHWTELGAYFGYKAIMDHISEKFPSAAPHPLSDYKIKYITIDDTDMNVYSGVGTGQMYEDAPYTRARFVEQTPYGKSKTETARIWDYVNEFFRSTSVTHTKDGSQPSAVLIMDSFGLNAVAYLAESFSAFGVQPVWSYNTDYDLVAELKADYIIEILEERDLSVLLSGS